MADGSIYIPVEIDDADAAKQLAALNRRINALENDISKGKAAELPIAEQLRDAQKAAIETLNEIDRLKAELASSEKKTSIYGNVDANQFANELEKQKELKAQIAEQEKLLAQQEKAAQRLEAEDAKRLEKLNQQTEALEAQKSAAGELEARVSTLGGGEAMARLRSGFENIKTSIAHGTKKILLWGFAIRSTYFLIRKLRTYLTEAITTFASSDSEAQGYIDGLKNSLAGLKAQWGAAFGPILSVVAPILQTLISWLTAAANAVAAFFAALGGRSTYKRAVTGLDSVADAASGAGSAAEEAKKQLMGIDELNVLQDNTSSGGGGGGGGSSDATQYEDAEISEGVQNFVNKVQPIIEWLKDNLPFVKNLVLAIGAGFLTWKIASALGASLQTIAALAVLIGLAVLVVRDYMDMWVNGIDWDKLIYYLGLIAIAAVVAGLAFGKPVAVVLLLAGGIALLVLAFKQWNETGELTNELIAAIVAGILLIGVAIALVLGWPALLVAAIVAALTYIGLKIYQKWDEIVAWWDENVTTGLRDAWNEFKTDFNTAVEHIKTTIDKALLRVKSSFESAKAAIIAKFQSIKTWWNDMIDNLKTGWQGFVDWLGSIAANIASPFITAINAILSAWNAVADTLNSISIDIPAINMFGQNLFEGAHIGLNVPYANPIVWGAKGGILNSATLIGAGEAGKEALIPLERNTGWMKTLAEQLVNYMSEVSLPTLPAVASGVVVPPNSYNSGYGFNQELADKLASFLDSYGATGSTTSEMHTHVYLDKREIGEAVTEFQTQQARGRGR